MQDLLESSIFPVGTKIITSKKFKHSSMGPFSVGFVSYIESYDRHYPNVIMLRIIIIRKGKRGKQRLSSIPVLTNIFSVEDMTDKSIAHVHRRMGYRDGAFICFEKMPVSYTNIFDMAPIEFLGWGSAYIRSLAHLYDAGRIEKHWPERASNPINRMNNASSKFVKDPEATIEAYSTKDFRGNFVELIRKMESSINRAVLVEGRINVKRELGAMSYLLYNNILNKHELYDMDILINTYNEYSERLIKLNETVTRLDKNRNVNYFDWIAKRGKKHNTTTKKKQPVKEYGPPIGVGDLIKKLKKYVQREIPVNHFEDIIFPSVSVAHKLEVKGEAKKQATGNIYYRYSGGSTTSTQ